jgi:hypothetical protein
MARRPSDHRQRSSCLEAAEDLLNYQSEEGEALPESISAVLRTMFMPVRARYTAARRQYRSARAARHGATRTANEADKVFDQTGREWIKGVTDGKGHHLPREFAKLLDGTLPGELFLKSYRKEVDLTRDLLDQLVHFPHLKGDPNELAAFMAAHTSLAAAVKMLEAAKRTQRDRKTTLDTVSSQFDKKWTALAEVIEEESPELAAQFLPNFPPRSSKPSSGGRKPGTSRGTPSEAGTQEVDEGDELDDLDDLDGLEEFDDEEGDVPAPEASEETEPHAVCVTDVAPDLS